MSDRVTPGNSQRHAPRLVVLTDTTLAPEPVLEVRIERVLGLAEPGQVLVVLRDKELTARRRLAWGARLRELTRRTRQGFAVAERVDLAMLLDADGVHLGEDGVTVAEARSLLPAGAWVSRACHEPARVASFGADAVLLSPVCAARKGKPPLGVEALTAARACLASQKDGPALYALGGVDESSAAECIRHGADGVAVIGAALDGRDPLPLLRALGIQRPDGSP